MIHILPRRLAGLRAARLFTFLGTTAPGRASSRTFLSLSGARKIQVTWRYEKDGKIVESEGSKYQSFLDIAKNADIEIEGACGGNASCSTCHVYLSEEDYKAFPEPDEDELDMLDLAAGVKDTSRLACQMHVKHTKLEKITLEVPKETNNIFE